MRVLLFLLGWAAAVQVQLNPISKVAALLEGMQGKVELDGKAEQELYDTYKCWCTKTLNSKAASMAANDLRITELAAYIDDLENGRVELTSERTTLEAEMADLEKAIQSATVLRNKEHEEYLAAKQELDQAVTALDSAVQTLGSATEDHMDGGVFSSVSAELRKAVDVGHGFLAKKRVDTLMRDLAVQPSIDWKKVNRDATFKKQYAARSGEIQQTLADMLATFTSNRDAAVTAEEKAQTDYDSLMDSKKGQLGAAKQAMLDKSSETGARGTALSDSTSEKEDLEGQNGRDQGYVADTKQACQTKADEWAERKRLRTEELVSISTAIATLRSDDSRDLFKRSFDNKPAASFVQLRSRVLVALRRARSADPTKTAKVQKLALHAAKAHKDGDVLAEVKQAVSGMMTDLNDEAAEDVTKKNQCEQEQMAETQQAKVLGQAMDTSTAEMDRLNAEIATAHKAIADIDQEVADLEQAQRDADDQREKEAAEHATNKADDNAAIGVIDTTVQVLEEFYTQNQLAMLQDPVAAGEAPPDAPGTWDSSYGGGRGEQQGIVGLLELIKSDLETDIQTADSNEQTAITTHGSFTADTTSSVDGLGTSKAGLEGQIANDETSATNEAGSRTANGGDLTATQALLKGLQPGCDYLRTHFEARRSARSVEIAGLESAQTALNDATV